MAYLRRAGQPLAVHGIQQLKRLVCVACRPYAYGGKRPAEIRRSVRATTLGAAIAALLHLCGQLQL